MAMKKVNKAFLIIFSNSKRIVNTLEEIDATYHTFDRVTSDCKRANADFSVVSKRFAYFALRKDNGKKDWNSFLDGMKLNQK